MPKKKQAVQLPQPGSRWWFSWRERFGTVTALPYGTCVDARLDSPSTLPPRDDMVALAGLEWAEGVKAGSIVAAHEQLRRWEACRRCPACNSTDVVVGAFVLSCLACGWHHLNQHPCTVCGAPSFSVVGSERGQWYGCKQHSAMQQFQSAQSSQES